MTKKEKKAILDKRQQKIPVEMRMVVVQEWMKQAPIQIMIKNKINRWVQWNPITWNLSWRDRKIQDFYPGWRVIYKDPLGQARWFLVLSIKLTSKWIKKRLDFAKTWKRIQCKEGIHRVDVSVWIKCKEASDWTKMPQQTLHHALDPHISRRAI